MQIIIKTTSGSEVRWLGTENSTPRYYGEAEKEVGEWKIDLAKVQEYLCKYLQERAFGGNVEKFILGFEIGNLKEWENFFTALENYASYRPKMHAVISVCQIEWNEVKLLPASEQYLILKNGFLSAVNRVGLMKRKPQGFNFQSLSVAVAEALASAKAEAFELKQKKA